MSKETSNKNKKMNKKGPFIERILIFEPHPDDVAYQIAGTVAKWLANSKEVFVCTVTNGNNSTFNLDVKADQIENIMMKEHQVALKLLGLDENHYVQWKYDDLASDIGRDRLPLLKDMILLIRKFKPTTVVTMDPKNTENEENPDHRLVAMTGFEAAAMAAYPNVFPEQFTENGISQHFVSRLLFYMTQDPNVFSDISGDFIELKKKVGAIYQSQLQLMVTEIDKRLSNMGLTPDLLDINQDDLWKSVCESSAEEIAAQSKIFYKNHLDLAPRVPLEYAEAFRMMYLGVVAKLSEYLPKEWLTL